MPSGCPRSRRDPTSRVEQRKARRRLQPLAVILQAEEPRTHALLCCVTTAALTGTLAVGAAWAGTTCLRRSYAPRRPSGGQVTDETEREIVDALVALGVDEDEARRAVSEDRVPLVLVRELLGEEPRYTLEEVAERGGIEVGVLRTIFAALGLPMRDRYGDSDVQEAAQLAELLEVFSEDTLVRLARVRGISVSRIAMGDVNAVRDELIAPLRQDGADDLRVAVSLVETARSLLPVSADLLVHAHRRALLHVLSSEVAKLGAREGAQELDLAVGFVDLVGYTALSARVDPAGLDEVLELFEQRVFAVTAETEGIDLVKFLGDAAMLVSTDVVELTDILIDLATEHEDFEEAPLRAGVASGGTLVREGDYFGPAVNMAARLTDRARPWTVLADDGIEDRLEGHFDIQPTRPMRIRGVGLRRPLSVRRRT